MSVVVRMEMPSVCITENGYYGYCPMDRVWCIQRNAPPDITMGEAYEAMTDKIPAWCPIICSLPEGHGRLVDIDRKFLRVATDGHGMSLNWRGSIAEMIDEDNMRGVEIIVPAEAERSET